MAILQFFIAFIIVFAIGMGIRYLITKNKKSKNQAAAPPPPAISGSCPQCGKPIQPGASFCDTCGTKVR
jgi:hypothetical protein